ncbi:MAG: hypothetical protein HQL49_00845 [Gammaproteobacteria bacterium]|nr:hypothetical protein [Gammaproteobacteria bacterium]
MSEKSVRLYVVGSGDAELQSLIKQGLLALGKGCHESAVSENCVELLDTLSQDEIPIIIKPYNAA